MTPFSPPEWKQLDPTSPTWAIRHFDSADAKLDPTSPIGKPEGDNQGILRDREIVGLTFQMDTKAKKGFIRHLTNPTNSLQRVAPAWQEYGAEFVSKPVIRLIEPGIIEISCSLDKEDQPGMFLILLGFALGHGANF
jgi:hypothetical protein